MEAYFGLFGIAFLAATLLPLGSEAWLIAMATSDYPLFWLWFWATLGNSLGSVVNYLIGRYLLHYQNRKWFPVKPQQIVRLQPQFQRYGSWTLLFAWLPIIGDALTVLAGIFKVNWIAFVILVTLGKGLRYAVVLGLFNLF